MRLAFRRIERGGFVAVVALLVSLARAGAQAPAPDIARGEHLATALAGCTDCHGANLAGGRSFTRGGITVAAANLTPGLGGIGALRDGDLVRAIRAGIAPDGRALVVMPWREYRVMTDADAADLVAYLRSLPPVDNAIPPPSAARTATSTDDVPAPRVAVPPPAALDAGSLDARPSSGAYIATIGGCRNCHAANLAGSARPNGESAPNISRDGIGGWSFADFQTAMRTGTTPGGHVLSGEMPWKSIGRMTDAELRTLYDYLESQPPRSGS